MVGQFYPILGIQAGRGPNGHVPVRMEVDDWWTSKKPIHISQHSLVIEALNRMYEMSPHDKLSYYQIAGIHNQPIVPWDGAPFDNKNYCMHSQPNFPNWHRPYCVLLEQRLYEVMVTEIIPLYPPEDQAELKHAADQWRFPFWDFAAKKPQPNGPPDFDVPKLVRDKYVEIRTPKGTEKVINPFWGFRMKDGVSMGDPKLAPDVVTRDPFTRAAGSSRHAYEDGAKEETVFKTEEQKTGIQNNDGIVDDLTQWKWEGGGSLNSSIKDWFYRVLLILPFPNFATKKADIGAGKMTSLEDIHDVLHVWCGGSFGHLAEPSCGAMDPLFWLLHVNVDRMFDLWAGLHPQESRDWLASDPDAVAPLIPFRSNQYGDYLNARDVWESEFFGYTYPETRKWIPSHQTDNKFDEKKMATELAISLNQKYNSAASAQKKSHLTKVRDPPTDKPISHPDAVVDMKASKPLDEQIAGDSHKGASISNIPDGQKAEDVLPEIITSYDYIINVTFEKYALDGHNFTIHFFIGNVPKGTGRKTMGNALTQVGEIYNFVDPVEFDKGGCANCAKQKRERIQSSGSIPITNALLTRHKQQIPHDHESGDKHTLKTMDPEHVIPFLVKHFHWRVTDREGNVIDKSRILSLKVSVAMGTAEHYTDDSKLSNFTNYKILYDITKGAESGTGAHPDDNLFPDHEEFSLDKTAAKA